jgi:hypothetical protein
MREKHGELLLENCAGGWPKGGANVPWGGTRDCENADAEKFANENKGDVAREQDMATGWTTLVMVGDTLEGARSSPDNDMTDSHCISAADFVGSRTREAQGLVSAVQCCRVSPW